MHLDHQLLEQVDGFGCEAASQLVGEGSFEVFDAYLANMTHFL